MDPKRRGRLPCATFWADESLVLVFHHLMLSKRTGHESSAFWTLFHVVGVCSSFIVFLLPLRTTVRGVTFGNESVLGCLRVEMGICAVRLRDAFGLWYVHGKCDKLPLLLLRSSMWVWGGASVADHERGVDIRIGGSMSGASSRRKGNVWECG